MGELFVFAVLLTDITYALDVIEVCRPWKFIKMSWKLMKKKNAQKSSDYANFLEFYGNVCVFFVLGTILMDKNQIGEFNAMPRFSYRAKRYHRSIVAIQWANGQFMGKTNNRGFFVLLFKITWHTHKCGSTEKLTNHQCLYFIC